MTRTKTLLTLVLGVFLTLAASAPALGFTIEYDTGITDDSVLPAADTPWLTATFETQVGGGVLLTLDAVNLTAAEYVSDWFFNFNPDKDLSALTFTWQSGLMAESVAADTDDFNVAGFSFDFDFAYDTSNDDGERFEDGDSSVYLIQGLADLMEEDFLYYAVQNGNGEMLLTAAHVQCTGPDAEDSCWITGDVAVTPVPEPGTMALAALGLVGLAWRKRRNWRI